MKQKLGYNKKDNSYRFSNKKIELNLNEELLNEMKKVWYGEGIKEEKTIYVENIDIETDNTFLRSFVFIPSNKLK